MTELPATFDCGGVAVTLSHAAPADADGLQSFANALPQHDLLFLTRDITHPKVVAAWMQAAADGSAASLIARANGEIVGMSAIVREKHGWSPHVADLRIAISNSMRGKGLGRILVNECVAVALESGAEKLTARMTPDQRGAIALFEEAGFRGEALLRDHVKDGEGNPHDLAILSMQVAEADQRHNLYGFDA